MLYLAEGVVLRKSVRDKFKLLLQTGSYLLVYRIMLSFVKYPQIRRGLNKIKPQQKQNYTFGQIAWAVSALSRRLPLMTCFVQALTAHKLLKQNGHNTLLCIGVKRGQEFESHAWVVCQDQVILGNIDNLDEYQIIFEEK
ncbi:MAG: lasso peptide biosynthesis B2 protein [Oligoflexia bacterium]|nr:lasso peptide biosynthesis B2 protein [Oligoflexia bacterium]